MPCCPSNDPVDLLLQHGHPSSIHPHPSTRFSACELSACLSGTWPPNMCPSTVFSLHPFVSPLVRRSSSYQKFISSFLPLTYLSNRLVPICPPDILLLTYPSSRLVPIRPHDILLSTFPAHPSIHSSDACPSAWRPSTCSSCAPVCPLIPLAAHWTTGNITHHALLSPIDWPCIA